MNISTTILAAAFAATAFSAPAGAQEAEFRLPEQCVASSDMHGMDHAGMDHGDAGGMEMPGMDGQPEHVQENMRKMMVTVPAMNEGMMNADADVAFACAMIAHHQGAIDMAQVLLAHGEDPQMRALAESIIAAQVGEIEQMTTWLAETAD